MTGCAVVCGRGSIRGRAPWFSADAGDQRIRAAEPQELIDVCLHCPLPECVNCLDGGNGRVGRPKRIRDEELLALLNEGKTAREICAILGCARSTVQAAKSRLGRTSR